MIGRRWNAASYNWRHVSLDYVQDNAQLHTCRLCITDVFNRIIYWCNTDTEESWRNQQLLSDEEFGLISKRFPLLTHRRSWWWTEIVTFGVAWRVGIRFPLISLPGYAVVWQKLACLKNCFLTLNYSSINGCAPNIFYPTGSLWTEMTIITAFLQAIALVSVWYLHGRDLNQKRGKQQFL